MKFKGEIQETKELDLDLNMIKKILQLLKNE